MRRGRAVAWRRRAGGSVLPAETGCGDSRLRLEGRTCRHLACPPRPNGGPAVDVDGRIGREQTSRVSHVLALSTRRLLHGLGLIGLLVYAVVLVRYASYSVGSSDSSGYLNHARALASGQIVRPIRAVAALARDDLPMPVVLPLGFVEGPRPGTMVPSYPSGFPLHMAAFAAFAGWEKGPFLVSPVFAVLGVLVFYGLACELGLTPLESVAGSAILALHPLSVFMGLQPMSDVVASTWAALTVLTALRARRGPTWPLLAGAAFAMAFLVRPSNALLLLPLALALPSTLGVFSRFALGALPGFAFFFVLNQVAYGHPLRTGYGDVVEFLSPAFLPQGFRFYTRWLGATFTPVLPLAWLALVASRETRGRDRTLLLVWFSAFTAFYCAYWFHDVWWYLRFLLPAFPALVAGAVLAARPVWRAIELRLHLPGLATRTANLLPALALAVVVSREVTFAVHRRLLDIGETESVYPRACRLAAERLPAGAIVLSKLTSGALEAYTDLPQLRFDFLNRRFARRLLRRSLQRGRPWYALVHELEAREFEDRDLGKWRRIGAVGNVELLELEPESLLGALR
jgi:hypothetical protein